MKNNKSQNVLFAGVDDGFFSIKVVDEQGNMSTIASRATHDITMVDVNAEGDKSFIFETESGRKFTVDENVPSPLDTRALAQPYPISDLNRILIHAGLLNAGFGGKDVSITTGLPVRDYFLPTTEKNITLIEAKTKNVSQKIFCGLTRNIETANIVSSQVCSEGLAAFIDLLIDMEGNPTERATALQSGVTAIIDIGGHTTDCAVLLPKMRINMERSGSVTVGVLNLHDGIQRSIAGRFSMNQGSITKRQIESALSTNSVTISREKIDVSDIVISEKDKLFEQIIMAERQIMGNDDDIENLIFVGGGTIVFEQKLRETFKGCFIPEHPEFANARGMMKLAKYLSKP
jgi:plasmid segregation protein ParM